MLKFFSIGVIVCFTIFSATLSQAKSIVVLGDSISASYRFEVQHGWVYLLQQKLKSSHPDYTIGPGTFTTTIKTVSARAYYA